MSTATMEMSSPLASMHPPRLEMPAPWMGGCGRDLRQWRAPAFGTSKFNFRDMSMKKSGSEYHSNGSSLFTMDLMRGSSPTASLAADISSNLHVDQSPQFQTPRRSLFSRKELSKRAEGTKTPDFRWEGVTTPPIPSSSPCFVPDSMDISPLPHKAPFSFLNERAPLASPTPDPTPSTAEEDMLSPCDLPTQSQFPFPSAPLPTQRPSSANGSPSAMDTDNAPRRRKATLLRPSLSRAKNYSTNSVYFKYKGPNANPLPAFKFGAGVESLSNTSSPSPSLDECFSASPPQERKPFPMPSVVSRKPLLSSANLSRANGSPLSANVRKPVGPPTRPRSKFRRSLSMYEHPGDVMNQREETDSYTPSGLQSVMDIDDTPALKLPSFTPSSEPDSLPRISDSTLVSVLNGDFDHMYDQKIIIDCRFEYEFRGGHIHGATNFCEKDQLAEMLFHANISPNTLLIFHCEYSAHRAPLMAKFVRHEDRKLNAFRYPQLSYPEMYILDGGYSNFFESNRTRCFPQNYLRMDAKEHENACERGMNKLRQRSKLNRAQTFAFGQLGKMSPGMDNSPTAAPRAKSGSHVFLGRQTSSDTFTFGSSTTQFDLPSGRIGTTRRMASY